VFPLSGSPCLWAILILLTPLLLELSVGKHLPLSRVGYPIHVVLSGVSGISLAHYVYGFILGWEIKSLMRLGIPTQTRWNPRHNVLKKYLILQTRPTWYWVADTVIKGVLLPTLNSKVEESARLNGSTDMGTRQGKHFKNPDCIKGCWRQPKIHSRVRQGKQTHA